MEGWKEMERKKERGIVRQTDGRKERKRKSERNKDGIRGRIRGKNRGRDGGKDGQSVRQRKRGRERWIEGEGGGRERGILSVFSPHPVRLGGGDLVTDILP